MSNWAWQSSHLFNFPFNRKGCERVSVCSARATSACRIDWDTVYSECDAVITHSPRKKYISLKGWNSIFIHCLWVLFVLPFAGYYLRYTWRTNQKIIISKLLPERFMNAIDSFQASHKTCASKWIWMNASTARYSDVQHLCADNWNWIHIALQWAFHFEMYKLSEIPSPTEGGPFEAVVFEGRKSKRKKKK